MNVQADKHRSERSFDVSDWVFLKLQPYKQLFVNKRVFHKLAARYFGPFQVMAKMGSVAYQLQLPPDSKIHNVFHVSFLKRSLCNHTVSGTLPMVIDDGELQVFPIKILDKRLVQNKGKMACEILVQWSNASEDDSTWMDVLEVQTKFPYFDVW